MRTVSDSQRLKPFDVARLKDSEMASQFQLELQIHFEALAQEKDNSVESQWDRFRSTVVNSATTLIGRRRGMFHERWIQRDSGTLLMSGIRQSKYVIKSHRDKSWMQRICVIG